MKVYVCCDNRKNAFGDTAYDNCYNVQKIYDKKEKAEQWLYEIACKENWYSWHDDYSPEEIDELRRNTARDNQDEDVYFVEVEVE